jgi:endonuclease/exonuclease/phosphatase family metal-dependent hydrolase
MMNLGSSMHVKVVLIIGDFNTKANTQDWKLTVGDDPNPLLNPQIFPLSGTSSLWATEVKVD